GPTAPATDDPADVAAAERADALSTRWFSDAVFAGEYPKVLVDFWEPICDFAFIRDGDMTAISTPLDFLGVNYYKSWVARATELPPPQNRSATDLGATKEVPPGRAITSFGWAICPEGMRDLLLWLRDRYPTLPPI